MNNPKVQLGTVVATPGCLAALEAAGQSLQEFLARRQRGDWGELSTEDAARNTAAVANGSRILSAYRLRTGVTIWLLTAVADDAGNRVTTGLLPEEY